MEFWHVPSVIAMKEVEATVDLSVRRLHDGLIDRGIKEHGGTASDRFDRVDLGRRLGTSNLLLFDGGGHGRPFLL